MAKCVCIKYNGKLLAPTPMISLTRSFQDVAGRHVGSTLSVQLQGKIVRGTTPGATQRANYIASYPCVGVTHNDIIGLAGDEINGLLYEEDRLRQVFIATTGQLYTDYTQAQNLGVTPANNLTPDIQTNKFELSIVSNEPGVSSPVIVIEGYGRVTNYNSTSESYINTIDYTVDIDIEEHKSLFNNNDTRYLLSSYTDTLNIEPLSDFAPFDANDPALSTYFGVGYNNNTNRDYKADQSYPKFNISRTISAVGKHSNNPYSNNKVQPQGRTLGVGIGSAFSNARYYVLDRLKHLPTEVFMTNGYVTTNRVKVINADESGGSFSITETSLAVHNTYHPPFIDDWTAEVSFDGSFLQTVRINGTIKGLETYGIDIRNENASIMDGSQPGSWANTQNGTNPSASLDNIHSYAGSLPDFIRPQDSSFNTWSFPSVSPINTTNSATANINPLALPGSIPNPPGEIKIGKYQNAIQGMFWLKNSDHPYRSPIFRRAELFAYASNINNQVTNPYKWLNSAQAISERSSFPPSVANVLQLNPIPISMTESHRKNVGEIDYSFEFNNRPLNLIQGSISESLTVNDTFPTQQIAEIFVLGRKLGPVLQDLGTVTSSSREVTLEVVIPRPRMIGQRLIFPTNIFTAATGLVEQLNPKYTFGTTTATSIKSYVKNDTHNYNPLEGRLSISKSWIWQRAK
jgi:hypothetical protein